MYLKLFTVLLFGFENSADQVELTNCGQLIVCNAKNLNLCFERDGIWCCIAIFMIDRIIQLIQCAILVGTGFVIPTLSYSDRRWFQMIISSALAVFVEFRF